VPSSTAAKPVKLAQKYPTWGAWVDSGDWAKSSPTGTLTLPANASEIMILALDPDVSVTQLARVTSRDQVLAARMLRLANSAYCAPLQEITTISEAVVRLGTASVRNVVLATCMASRLQSGNTYGAHGRGLAAHGIGTAFLAQLVARVAVVNQEEAFLYGLVHDIGKLLVLQLSKDYVRGGGKAPSDDEVRDVIEARHAEFGGRVLREWRLPPVIEEPVVHHHRPDECTSHTLEASVCYMANRLSHRYGFGCDTSPDAPVLEDPIAGKLGLTEAWLTDLDSRAPELFKNAADAFA
jgi:putative nucleotidyltransferase with HDIG domain